MPPRHAGKRRRAPFKRAFAKSLRANATEAERKLWALLRGRHLGGYRFRRQQPIGPYIVDFFCPSARLVVELDGSQHSKDEVLAYDAARGGFLAARVSPIAIHQCGCAARSPMRHREHLARGICGWTPPRSGAAALRRIDPPSRGGLKGACLSPSPPI